MQSSQERMSNRRIHASVGKWRDGQLEGRFSSWTLRAGIIPHTRHLATV